jgi:hypothetical protein
MRMDAEEGIPRWLVMLIVVVEGLGSMGNCKVFSVEGESYECNGRQNHQFVG